MTTPCVTLTVRIPLDATEPKLSLRVSPAADPTSAETLFNKAAVVLAALQLGRLRANIEEAVAAHDSGPTLAAKMDLYRRMLAFDEDAGKPEVGATEVFRE